MIANLCRAEADPTSGADLAAGGDVGTDARQGETTAQTVPDATEGWDHDRWAQILDRIEHRQANVGLRYWVPPLWLEVTMSGPDSDLWSIAETPGIGSRSWDWQSLEACPDVAELAIRGADDDLLLAAVGRYTMENLILNAAHEIGEWLRFDARRVFPAHTGTSDSDAAIALGSQGNGPVQLVVHFGATAGNASGTVPPSNEAALRQLSSRIATVAAAWRFTYLPGVSISYGHLGPQVTDAASGMGASTEYQMTWSRSTLEVADGATENLMQAVCQDVHRLLIRYETDRICRAFHVDGRQVWRLGQSGDGEAEPLSVSVTYVGNLGSSRQRERSAGVHPESSNSVLRCARS